MSETVGLMTNTAGLQPHGWPSTHVHSHLTPQSFIQPCPDKFLTEKQLVWEADMQCYTETVCKRNFELILVRWLEIICSQLL